MHEDDFLCPECGAIWGERIYRAPATIETDFSAENEALTGGNPEPAVTPPAPQEAVAQKRSTSLLPLLLLLLGTALVFILMQSEWFTEAGESSIPAATTDHVTIGKQPETTSPPTFPTMPPMTAYSYAVVFVDRQKKPIEGVMIANPLEFASTPFLVSNKDGAIALHSDTEIAYIQVASVPSGYTFSLLNEKLYFGSDRYVMTIVLDKADVQYTSYTVQFVDPDGNPIRRVKIENPTRVGSYLYSDSYGKITFQLPSSNTQQYIWITAVPEGYSDELVGQRIYFVKDQTSMTISLTYIADETEPADAPAA